MGKQPIRNYNKLAAVLLAFAVSLLELSSLAQTVSSEYVYDDLGRLVKKTSTTGFVKEYVYDPAGNRKEVVTLVSGDDPINDGIPSVGTGSNYIELTDWPTGTAPSGFANVASWHTSSTFYDETRWVRVTGPGQSGTVTAMDAGQTSPDASGGGTNKTNLFTIDPTTAYEFSLYFRKYDLVYQSLYFGTSTVSQNVEPMSMVRYASDGLVERNPYFLKWSPSKQQANLDPNKWYKIVAYVLPAGYEDQNQSDWGGVYDVETGQKIHDVINYRWNENRLSNEAYARFFTFYYQASQNRFTTYFYQPSIRKTNITFSPIVPSITLSRTDTEEGSPLTFFVDLSEATTVETRVNYEVTGGTAESGDDFTPVSDTLVIPAGTSRVEISIPTNDDSIEESTESVLLTLSSPLRLTLSDTSEPGYILDNDTVNDGPINDSVPTLASGSNLITLAQWPIGSAPNGYGHPFNWPTSPTHYEETRWARVPGPGQSGMVTAMDVGQTNPDVNGGGTDRTNFVSINPTKAYEFSVYFRKYDQAYQNLYFGVPTGSKVKSAHSDTVNGNPYFMAWNTNDQANHLDSNKWYKAVGYVLPEGYPIQNQSTWGGVYDVETGQKINNLLSFRWNENRPNNTVFARFFVHHSEQSQNRFTNYFYQPSMRETDITFTPVVPSITLTHQNATEGQPLIFSVNLSAPTTVETRVSYTVGDGTASAAGDDYTPISGTVIIPAGSMGDTVVVQTNDDSEVESNESVVLSLSSPVRATLSDTTESAFILNNDIANVPPTAEHDVYTLATTEGIHNLDVLANDNDPDGDNADLYILTVDGVDSPATVSVGLDNRTLVISFNTQQDYLGEFTYVVSDGDGGTASATVQVGASGFGGGLE